VSHNEIAAFRQDKTARFKIPQRVEKIAILPRTAWGKYQKPSFVRRFEPKAKAKPFATPIRPMRWRRQKSPGYCFSSRV